MQEHWHNLSTDESLAMQESSESGISVDEVVRRQKRYGMNKLAEAEKTSAFLRFISQYNDPLNYLLMGAALVALLINPDHPGDAIFIFIVLTANAFFGFWQENQAEQAMDSLKQMSISNCVVILRVKSRHRNWCLVMWFVLNRVSMCQQMYDCYGLNSAKSMNPR